ncbi:MAG: hypothetical protein NVS2B9_10340 [Myxococcales bacterium]
MQERVRKSDVRGEARERLAVVVREGLKGNHLLFDAAELAGSEDGPRVHSSAVAQELGRVGVELARSASIDGARGLIASCSPDCRRELARLYLAFLGRCASAQGDAS